MGTWGTAIFSDDTASDVRGDFRDMIGDGLSPEEATDRLIAEYASSIDDPPFWLGLAVTQWKCGRLQERVKARALEIIDSGADLARWSVDEKLSRARQSVLTKTRELLLSSQPAPKRIAKRFRQANDWPVGELVAYRMPSGKHVVLVVVGHNVDKGGKAPTVDLLDYYEDTGPTYEDACRRPPRYSMSSRDDCYVVDPPFMLGAVSAREIPGARLTRLGVYGAPRRRWMSTRVLLWRHADSFIEQTMTAERIVCRPGPGGDDHQRWETGDVLAHQTASGTYVLFHLIARYQGDGLDGAPIVALLNWRETSLPTADVFGSGMLVPYRLDLAPGPKIVISASGQCDACFVFVHEAGDAVSSTALRRIGHLPPTSDHRVRSIASLPMAVRRIEDDLGLRA